MAQEGEKVVLNIYDLSQGLARQLSASLLGKVIDGIWHTGIVVYGQEYYFGGGIQRIPVGETPYGTPLKVVELGYTQLPKEVFEDYLNDISPRYTMATYNVLRHNCNNFSEEVAQFLVGSGIPQYILGLPDDVMSSPMGGMLLPMIQQLDNTLKHNQAPAFVSQGNDKRLVSLISLQFKCPHPLEVGPPRRAPSHRQRRLLEVRLLPRRHQLFKNQSLEKVLSRRRNRHLCKARKRRRSSQIRQKGTLLGTPGLRCKTRLHESLWS